MENENHKNGRGIFYGVIGVATLVVAIVGATFAYFTASQASNNGDITGNAASVSFGLRVVRAETTDQTNGGLIPMSNSMVSNAVGTGGVPSTGGTGSTVACVDNNGNSVCQIYKVTVYNTSSAALFLDGYVTLTGGLSSATVSTDVPNNPTAMRWAQVFLDSGTTGYSTGTTDFEELGATNAIAVTAIPSPATGEDAHNKASIFNGTESGFMAESAIVGDTYATINGVDMPAIKANYIRLSSNGQDSNSTGHVYSRDELEDALVFDLLVPVGGSKDVYFVVWLHETGTKQNPTGQEGAPTEENFFGGKVTFQSGQGGEVSATFTGITRVASNTTVSP